MGVIFLIFPCYAFLFIFYKHFEQFPQLDSTKSVNITSPVVLRGIDCFLYLLLLCHVVMSLDIVQEGYVGGVLLKLNTFSERFAEYVPGEHI